MQDYIATAKHGAADVLMIKVTGNLALVEDAAGHVSQALYALLTDVVPTDETLSRWALFVAVAGTQVAHVKMSELSTLEWADTLVTFSL